MKLLRELIFPLIAVLAAFVVGGILILLIGDSPIQAYNFSWVARSRGRTGSGTRSFMPRR